MLQLNFSYELNEKERLFHLVSKMKKEYFQLLTKHLKVNVFISIPWVYYYLSCILWNSNNLIHLLHLLLIQCLIFFQPLELLFFLISNFSRVCKSLIINYVFHCKIILNQPRDDLRFKWAKINLRSKG